MARGVDIVAVELQSRSHAVSVGLAIGDLATVTVEQAHTCASDCHRVSSDGQVKQTSPFEQTTACCRHRGDVDFAFNPLNCSRCMDIDGVPASITIGTSDRSTA